MPLLNASDQPEFMNKIFSWVQYNRMFQSMHITRSVCSMSVWQVGTGRLLLADGDTHMLVVICVVSVQQLDRTDTVRHLHQNSEEGFPPSGSLAPELNYLNAALAEPDKDLWAFQVFKRWVGVLSSQVMNFSQSWLDVFAEYVSNFDICNFRCDEADGWIRYVDVCLWRRVCSCPGAGAAPCPCTPCHMKNEISGWHGRKACIKWKTFTSQNTPTPGEDRQLEQSWSLQGDLHSTLISSLMY